METVTFKLEAWLPAGIALPSWRDLTADVLLDAAPATWTGGAQSTSPTALMADPGVLNFALDNGISNSARLAGYYSPGHANCRQGFAKGIKWRLTLTYGGFDFYQNIYWMIKDPLPTPGVFDEAVTRVEAGDWLYVAKETPMKPLAIETNKRVDELIPDVLAICGTQPAGTAYYTGDSTLASAFDKDEMARENVYSILAKLSRSEFGRIWMGLNDEDKQLVFENRNMRSGDTIMDGTLANEMEKLDFFPEETAYDQVQVTINPRTTDSVNVIVAKMEDKIKLTPGESQTFTLNFTSPVNGEPISAFNIVDPLVAGTHYRFGSSSGGTQDLNASLTVTFTYPIGGNSVTVTVENTGTKKGWINYFAIMGKGIYYSDTYTATVGTGLRVLNFDMPYQSNPRVADRICQHLYGIVSGNGYRGLKIGFRANSSANLMTVALNGDISTQWQISETQTAVPSTQHWCLNGYKMTLGPGCMLDVEWWLVPRNQAVTDPPLSLDYSVITKATFTSGDSLTFSHESTGDPLLVKVSMRGGSDPGHATATFNGDAMTLVVDKEATDGGGYHVYSAIFYLAAPDTGVHSVVLNWTSSHFGGAAAYNLGNCVGYANADSATGNTAVPTLDIISAANDQVVDALASAGVVTTNATVGAGQVRRENVRANNTAVDHWMISGSSSEPGQPLVTMSWNLPDTRVWVLCGVSLIAGTAGDGDTRSLTQTVRPQNTLNNTYNVRDLGAKGDGVTDDWSAIMGAIAMAAVAGVQKVEFPAGTYIVSDTVLIDESLVLKGAGKDRTGIYCTDPDKPVVEFMSNILQGIESLSLGWRDAPVVVNAVTGGGIDGGDVFTVTLLVSNTYNIGDHITVAGVDAIWGTTGVDGNNWECITGTNSTTVKFVIPTNPGEPYAVPGGTVSRNWAQGQEKALYIHGVGDFHGQDLWIWAPREGIMVEDSTVVSFDNIEVSGYGSTALTVWGKTALTGVSISHFFFNAGLGAWRGEAGGIYLHDFVGQFTASQGLITLGMHGIVTEGTPATPGYIPQNCLFTDVIFDSSADKVALLQDLRDSNFGDCLFSGGRATPGEGVYLSGCYGVTFTGGAVMNCGLAGVYFDSTSSHLSFDGVRVYNNNDAATSGQSGYQIQANSHDFSITNSALIGNCTSIHNNTSRQDYGIWMDTGCDRYIIEGNNFDGNTVAGLLNGSAAAADRRIRGNIGLTYALEDVTPIYLAETTTPAAPIDTCVVIYAADAGGGKTKLMARFPTGAAQQIAIEP